MRLQPLREVNDAEEMQGVGVKPGYRKNGCYSTSNAELLFKQISELSQFLLLEMTFSLELLPPQHTHTHIHHLKKQTTAEQWKARATLPC